MGFFFSGAGFAVSFESAGFAGLLAALSAGAAGAAAGWFAGGVVLDESVGVSAGAAGTTGAGAGSAGPTLSPSDLFSKRPGIEKRNAIKKNDIAAVIVIFAKTV